MLNIMNIVNSCVNQSDIADALIALISERALCLLSRLLHLFLVPAPPQKILLFFIHYYDDLFIFLPVAKCAFLLSFKKDVLERDQTLPLLTLVLYRGQSRYSLPC